MAGEITFEQAWQEHAETLAQYVPVVARVHGKHHPEFLKVRYAYDTIAEKVAAAGAGRPVLDAEFRSLRELTGGYHVPDDVCESYEAVYQMLQALDTAYSA